MPHFRNGKCNLLKANKIFFFLQNLSKFTPFASLYSDPAYGRAFTIIVLCVCVLNTGFKSRIKKINKHTSNIQTKRRQIT